MPQPQLQVRASADSSPDRLSGLRIDGPRMLACVEDLAKIGADPAGGITRLGLSPEENAAREFLREQSVSAGLAAETDPAGNLLVRRPGARHANSKAPVLLVGS